MPDYTCTWVPEAFVDEIYPTPLASPDAWLQRAGEGWTLRSAETDEDELAPIEIKAGETVSFALLRSWPTLTVAITPDDFSTIEPIPEGATQFVDVNDGESWGDGMEECVAAAREHSDEDSFGIEVYPYSWDELDFRLVVEGEAARLEPVDPAAYARLVAPAEG